MVVYGYARVSTIGQTLAAQEAALHEAGAAKVFKEKISGGHGLPGVQAISPVLVKQAEAGLSIGWMGG